MVQPEDLQSENIIVLATDDLLQSVSGWLRQNDLEHQVILRTSSVEAVRSLVGTEAGVAILPDIAVRPYTLEGDRLEARAIKDLSMTLDVGLVWRQGSSATAQANVFKTLARDFKTMQ